MQRSEKQKVIIALVYNELSTYIYVSTISTYKHKVKQIYKKNFYNKLLELLL